MNILVQAIRKQAARPKEDGIYPLFTEGCLVSTAYITVNRGFARLFERSQQEENRIAPRVTINQANAIRFRKRKWSFVNCTIS